MVGGGGGGAEVVGHGWWRISPWTWRYLKWLDLCLRPGEGEVDCLD